MLAARSGYCDILTAGHAESRVRGDERDVTTDLDGEGRRECSKRRGVHDSKKQEEGSQKSVGGREGWMGDE